jgi:hypothetical protein
MKFRDFNCESTSAVSERQHNKILSEQLQKDVDAFLAKKGEIQQYNEFRELIK